MFRPATNRHRQRTTARLDHLPASRHHDGVATRSRLTEVAAPEGDRFLVGPGPFARQSGGAFSIVVYPYGHGDPFGGPATHTEPVVNAAEFRHRTEELMEAIRSGVCGDRLNIPRRRSSGWRSGKREPRQPWLRHRPAQRRSNSRSPSSSSQLLCSARSSTWSWATYRPLSVPCAPSPSATCFSVQPYRWRSLCAGDGRVVGTPELLAGNGRGRGRGCEEPSATGTSSSGRQRLRRLQGRSCGADAVAH